MTYVMSDLHGCYDKFIQMLKIIDFKDNDELYILGDVFDRGNKPIDILDYIISHKNIYLIKGNHEDMFCDYYINDDYNWIMYNGGDTTLKQIQEYQMKVSFNYIENLYKYIKKLPLYKVIEVNNRKFILVHAGLEFYSININKNTTVEHFLEQQNENTLLWDRDNIISQEVFKDYITISGHTPTINIRHILGMSNSNRILFGKGNIYIDCGCCFEVGTLGCLRLDDMKEFYID